jgi:hypothetical protein
MKNKIFTLLLILSAAAWFYSIIMRNIAVGNLLEFGTTQFRANLTEENERKMYASLAQNSIIGAGFYIAVLLFAVGYMTTSEKTMQQHGWMLMSAILLFTFVPVELYCFWLDWKLIGLQYWGEWPVEEFRKALMNRVTALAGLPFIAQLCYFTIPILIIFKPLSNAKSI